MSGYEENDLSSSVAYFFRRLQHEYCARARPFGDQRVSSQETALGWRRAFDLRIIVEEANMTEQRVLDKQMLSGAHTSEEASLGEA